MVESLEMLELMLIEMRYIYEMKMKLYNEYVQEMRLRRWYFTPRAKKDTTKLNAEKSEDESIKAGR